MKIPMRTYHIHAINILTVLSLLSAVFLSTGFAQEDDAQKAPGQHEVQRVIDTITGWARARSAQDVDAYLAYYASEFRLPGNQSRADWEKNRRQAISGTDAIPVTVTDIEVELLNEAVAWARFKEAYKTGGSREQAGKVLWLRRQGSRWKIVQEMKAEEASAGGTNGPSNMPVPVSSADEMKLDIVPVERAAVADGQPVGTGSISAKIVNDAAVQKVVMKHQRPIQYVYRRALKYNPDLRGTVKVRLTIQKDGRVSKAEILSDTVKNDELARFIVRFARSWQIELKEPRAFATDLSLLFVPPH